MNARDKLFILYRKKVKKWDDPQTQEWIKQLEWLNSNDPKEMPLDFDYLKCQCALSDLAVKTIEKYKESPYEQGKLRGLREAMVIMNTDEELKAAVKQYRDPQTQADLELAAAVRKAFEKELQIGEMLLEELDNWAPYFERTIWSEEELIDWYKEQKRGEE